MSDRVSHSNYYKEHKEHREYKDERTSLRKSGLDPLNMYLLDPHSSLFQIATAFFFSLLLAPTSAGIVYVILFLVLWEVGLAIIYKLEVCFLARIGIVCASLLGFILGRLLWDPTSDPMDQARNFSLQNEKERIKSWGLFLPWLGDFLSKEIAEDLKDHTLEDSDSDSDSD